MEEATTCAVVWGQSGGEWPARVAAVEEEQWAALGDVCGYELHLPARRRMDCLLKYHDNT